MLNFTVFLNFTLVDLFFLQMWSLGFYSMTAQTGIVHANFWNNFLQCCAWQVLPSQFLSLSPQLTGLFGLPLTPGFENMNTKSSFSFSYELQSCTGYCPGLENSCVHILLSSYLICNGKDFQTLVSSFMA